MRDKLKLLSILAFLMSIYLVKADHVCNIKYKFKKEKDLTYLRLGLNYRYEFVLDPTDDRC